MDLIGKTLGQYRIVDHLGQGGMATIFKAYQPTLDRHLAVKILPAQHALTPGFSERFVREARTVAQLNHPNILPIIDFGQDGDLSYIVMKLVTGGTLKARMHQSLEPEEIARIIEQIAAALDHAHERGILHRDIKPSNVLLDEGDWVQLADFGLAKLMAGDQSLTGTGVGIGTPAYMSPEQGRGIEVDQHTDIYSLGVILYEMVVGRLPYKAETPMATVLKHIAEPLPLPSQVNPAVSLAVEAVIVKTLEKSPADRFGSAGEMAQALREAITVGTDIAFPVADMTQDLATPILDPELQLDVFLTPSAQPAPVFAPPLDAGSAPMPEITLPPEPQRPPEVAEFVGRQAELASFAQSLAVSHLAVITGMVGVGKTTLAAMLAQQAIDPDRTFWHSFHKGEGADVVIWKLAGFLFWQGQQDLWQMLQGTQVTGGQSPPAEMLLDYLSQMMHGQGYLLCLDDLQFVDDDPLLAQLLERLHQAVAAKDVSLIITSRRVPEFVQSDTSAALRGLSADDTDALLVARGVALSREQSSNLYTHTEGNAQLLTLAVEALRQAQRPERVIANLAETENIERYLIREVHDGLEEEEREVMSGIAVLMGYPGTRDAIETVLDGDSVRRMLSDLSGRHLLTVALGEWGREYSQHAMVQAFHYDLLGRRERREMHYRAGEYYADEEPDVLKAATHYERAGEVERAAELATSNVRTLINRGQARPLRGLLERIQPRRIEPPLRVAVYTARGQVHALLGQSDEARESYESAISELDALSDTAATRVLRAQACRGMGELLEHGAPPEALEWLHRGLEALAGDNNLEEAALRIKTGSVQIALGDLDAALRVTEQGLDLLSPVPSQLRASALTNLGMIYGFRGDLDRVKMHTEQGLEISRKLHDDFHIAETLNNLGIIKYMSGDWDGAIDAWQQALELAEKLGSIKQQAKLGLNLGFTYTRQGKTALAREHLERSLDLARDRGLGEHRVNVQSNLADLYLREGETAAATQALADAEALALEMEAKPLLPEIYRGWASAHLAQEDVQAAREYVDRALQLARELGMQAEEGTSLRILGQALLAAGQHEAALQALEKSLGILDGQDPYEAARTRVYLGRLLASGDDAQRGKTLLEEARATFQELGAQRDLDEVQESLSDS